MHTDKLTVLSVEATVIFNHPILHRCYIAFKMANNKDPLDIVQQFIDKNKDSFGQIGFGGGVF